MVNINGEIICTGEFTNTGTFGSNTISSNGSGDIFIASYDVSGNNLWARSAGGNSLDFGNKISHDFSGNLYITGTITDSATFDQISVTCNGTEDIFLASYDSAGAFRFVKNFGGPDHDRGQGVGNDKYGNIYMSGEYWTYVNFDTIYLQGVSLYDGFITRFGNYPVCSVTAAVTDDISCFNTCDGSITLTPAGLPPFQYYWPLLPQQSTGYVSGLCAGNYPVSVTDAYGCVTSTTVSVPQPSPISITGYAIVNTSCSGCSDGSIEINAAGGVGQYSYSWTDGSTVEDRYNLNAGSYGVCITDSNGCVFCDTFILINPATALTEVNITSYFDIQPNPFSTQTIISVDRLYSNEHFQLELYSLIGKRLKTIAVTGDKILFSSSDLSPGNYLIKLVNTDCNAIIKIKPVIIIR